jgi:hypothetical protein
VQPCEGSAGLSPGAASGGDEGFVLQDDELQLLPQTSVASIAAAADLRSATRVDAVIQHTTPVDTTGRRASAAAVGRGPGSRNAGRSATSPGAGATSGAMTTGPPAPALWPSIHAGGRSTSAVSGCLVATTSISPSASTPSTTHIRPQGVHTDPWHWRA